MTETDAASVWIITNPGGSPHAVFASGKLADQWLADNPMACAGCEAQEWHLHAGPEPAALNPDEAPERGHGERALPRNAERDAEIAKLRRDVASLRRSVDFHVRIRDDVSEVLDEALGTEEDGGAGEGLAAEVRLLADRYQNARRQEEILLRNWHGDRDKICAIRAWGERHLPPPHMDGLLAILEAEPAEGDGSAS